MRLCGNRGGPAPVKRIGGGDLLGVSTGPGHRGQRKVPCNTAPGGLFTTGDTGNLGGRGHLAGITSTRRPRTDGPLGRGPSFPLLADLPDTVGRGAVAFCPTHVPRVPRGQDLCQKMTRWAHCLCDDFA